MEEKTKIMRVAVRESMSLDLLHRLHANIIAVTEQLIETDPLDLSAFQRGATTVEGQHQSEVIDDVNKHKAQRPMSKS